MADGQRQTPPQDGFTLVELAMAMMIIGLVTGGLLMAQSFLDNARVNATIAEFKALRAAHYTFRDKYKALPGDMAGAMNRIPGCDAAHDCGDGDGNGMVGVRINNVETIAASAGVRENILYWKHLALADMIEGIDTAAPATAAASAYGVTHPAARIGGGWNAIMTSAEGFGDYGSNGLVFQLTGAPNTNAPVVEPRFAAQMDAKMDDGRPNTGLITAEDSVISNCDDDASNSYRTAVKTPECVMYFAVQ